MDELLTPKQIAHLCGVDPRAVRYWLADGILVGQRLGGRWVIAREDFEAALAAGRIRVTPTEQIGRPGRRFRQAAGGE